MQQSKGHHIYKVVKGMDDAPEGHMLFNPVTGEAVTTEIYAVLTTPEDEILRPATLIVTHYERGGMQVGQEMFYIPCYCYANSAEQMEPLVFGMN